ncbi:YesK family protein [Paenibacillus sp. 11B]|uniref:YesK family protein n=1 Tax=unclassified Paenibacillus TaxID=185978 RepID=UPI00264F28A0|nr:YesK family protein [Paenibacillus sp. 11B]MDN8591189.1 YesK family protein [Paenibacillus sp. 11B]
MDVLILWTVGMWAVLLLIEWLIYRMQGRRMTWVQYILPCVALLGGATVIMISIDIGGWNGIGYALLGASLGTSGMLTLITVAITDVVFRRRGRN